MSVERSRRHILLRFYIHRHGYGHTSNKYTWSSQFSGCRKIFPFWSGLVGANQWNVTRKVWVSYNQSNVEHDNDDGNNKDNNDVDDNKIIQNNYRHNSSSELMKKQQPSCKNLIINCLLSSVLYSTWLEIVWLLFRYKITRTHK